MTSPDAFIQRRIRHYARRARRAQRAIDRLAIARLLTFLALVGALSFSFSGDYRVWGALASLAVAALFVALIKAHEKQYGFRQFCVTLEGLSRDDLARRQLRLSDIDERPPGFPDDHPFAHDLDLVGSHGAIKLIDRSQIVQASARIRAWIDHPGSPSEVLDRQDAIRELAPMASLRLRLSALSVDQRGLDAGSELHGWQSIRRPWTTRSWFFWPSVLVGLSASILLVLRFLVGISGLPWLPVTAAATILSWIAGRTQRQLIFALLPEKSKFRAARAVSAVLERRRYHCRPLRDLANSLVDESGINAERALSELVQVTDALAQRSNGLAQFVLNFCVQWDAGQLRRLARWKARYGDHLASWYEALVEFEAYANLANFHWLFPEYSFPSIVESDQAVFRARRIGHPLIQPDKRVNNDYTIDGPGTVHLLTGSNMSGKSTFLRTIGLNWALARMGLPVCAERLECNLPDLWTSIRIQDSLSRGVSFFLAEVLRIKAILERAGTSGPMFFLLDEILRGTNSRERLIASRAIVTYLHAHRASGIITTHDLELLKLAESGEHVRKFHFRETLSEGQMSFDYILRAGELTSTNALRVMRFAGLPLDLPIDD